MIVAYFIVAGLLALVALGSGLMKIVRPKAKLQEMGAPMAWTADFPEWQVKAIGALEVLGAVGVIVPMATGIVPVLSPIAAIGLALVHVGAFVVHARRSEKPYVNMGIFALAGVAAALGFFALA
ncbi:DoxX family protein [Pseudolysinimonas sp.]